MIASPDSKLTRKLTEFQLLGMVADRCTSCALASTYHFIDEPNPAFEAIRG